MNQNLTLAILTVITGLGGLGTWYLITKGTDTFTKSRARLVPGYKLVACRHHAHG